MAKNVEVIVEGIDQATKVFDKVSREAEKSMDEIDRAIDEVDDVHVDAHLDTSEFENIQEPHIDADVDQAVRKADKVTRKLKDIPNFVYSEIKLNVSDFNSKMEDVAQHFRTVGEISGQMIFGSMMSFLPALIPILASTVGLLGGLASAFVAAGVGIAGFMAIAAPLAAQLYKLEQNAEVGSEKWNSYSTATQNAIKALSQVQKAFRELMLEFRDPVFEIFAMGLNMVLGLLEQAKPIIESAINGVKGALTSLDEATKSNTFKSFMQFLADQAGPMIQRFGQVAINIMLGVMNILMTFGPTAENVSNKLIGMTESFVQWSKNLEESQGFKNFISYIQTNGPKVLSFIGELIMFIINLGVTLAPLGQKVLSVANSIFQWMNSVMQTNPWLVKLGGYVLVFSGILQALTPLIIGAVVTFGRLASAVRFVWPFVQKLSLWVGAKLWTAFGKLSSMILRVLPIILRVGKFLLGITNPVGLVITIVTTLAILIWQNWDKIWAVTLQIFTRVSAFLLQTWQAIKTGAQVAWQMLQIWLARTFATIYMKARQIFAQIVMFLAQTWANITSTAQSAWQGLWSFLSGLWNNIWSTASSVFSSVISFFSNTWSSISSTAQSIWSGVVSFITGMWSSLSGSASSIFSSIYSTISGIWSSVLSSTSSIWDSVVSTITSAINSVIGSINTMIGAINGLSIDIPKIPDWVPGIGGSGGGSLSIPNIPTIPKLATGGVVKKPTIAQVGDAGVGNPEIVAPQNMIRKIIQDELTRAMNGGGGQAQTVIVPVELDGKEIARVTAPHMDRELGRRRTNNARSEGRGGM